MIVGHRDDIGFRRIKIKDVNWISGIIPDEIELFVKIRYQSKPLPCKIIKAGDDEFVVEFAQEIADPAPGQYAVFYMGDEMLGGGEIYEAN